MIDLLVDRQRSLYIDNLPPTATESSIQALFDDDFYRIYDWKEHQGPLVTQVIAFSNRGFCWVELASEALAEVAYQVWKQDPSSMQIDHQLLHLHRPDGYVRRPLPPPSPVVIPEFGLPTRPIPPDVFSLTALIDRQRSIHVSNIPEDSTKQELYWLFDSIADSLLQGLGESGIWVTHVLFRGGAFAWVEFQTEALAAEVLRFCKDNAECVRLGACKQKVWIQRPNGYDPRRSTSESGGCAPPFSPSRSGIFDLDYTVDRQRSLHVDNLPKGCVARGLFELFEGILRETRAGAAMQGPLVTHVLFKGGHFAWVEFQTEHFASLALGICNRDPSALQLGNSGVRLVVQRPVGYEYRSEGEEGKVGDRHSQAAGARPAFSGTDMFSFNYKVDRQRSLHVDNLPGDVTAEKILRHFEFVVHHTNFFDNPASAATAVTHVLYPGRSFAWVEFCSPALAGCVLDLCERSLEAVWMGGRNGVRLLVQRPRGYSENSSARSDSGSQRGFSGYDSSPPTSPSRTLDADSFPSLQASLQLPPVSKAPGSQVWISPRESHPHEDRFPAQEGESANTVSHLLPSWLSPTSRTTSPTWSAPSEAAPDTPRSVRGSSYSSLDKLGGAASEPWSLFAVPAITLPPLSDLSQDSQPGSSRRSSASQSPSSSRFQSLFESSVVSSSRAESEVGGSSPSLGRFESFFSSSEGKRSALTVQTAAQLASAAWPSIWSPQSSAFELQSPQDLSPSVASEQVTPSVAGSLSGFPFSHSDQQSVLNIMRSSGRKAGEGFDPFERWGSLAELITN